MTSSGLDLFTTHPISGVKQVQKSLNNELASTRQKLRGLVSTRYRDLLSTAEMIVDMDTEIHEVSDILGDVVRGCDSRAVAKRARGVGQLGRRAATDVERKAVRLHLLQLVPVVVKGLVREKRLQAAAKVLQLGRLLAKGFEGELVDESRSRIGNIRSALLRRIDSVLAAGPEKEQLLDAMCAYAIATRGSGKDVLERFLKMRLERITVILKTDVVVKEKVVQAEDSILRTGEDLKALAPKKLITALEALSTSPLLQGKDLRNIVELQLDRWDNLLGDDVLKFTFYTRIEGLSGPELRDMLTLWRRQALSSFVEQSSALLADASFSQVVGVREVILQTWIEAGSIEGEIKSLQEAFLLPLKHSIAARAATSKDIIAEIDQTMENWQAEGQLSLWNSDVTSLDVSNGATAFREAVLYRSRGLGRKEINVIALWEAWIDKINEIKAAIKGMEKRKWADEDDSDDEADLELLDLDPKALLSHLDSSKKEFEELSQKTLVSFSEKLDAKEPDFVGKTAFLLRLAREAFPLPSLSERLLRTLSAHVAAAPLQQFEKAVSRGLQLGTYTAKPLWIDDSPSLPSKQLFNLLRALSRAMTEAGADLWTPSAMDGICSAMKESISKLSVEGDDNEKQWQFDSAFLKCVYNEEAEDSALGQGAKESWSRVRGLFAFFAQ